MNLIQCLQKNSRCYRNTSTGTPVGILWHDTGAGNPELRRYVQPMEGDSNYNSMIALLGKNQYGNDWNHIEVSAGLNAWIGKLANGSIATIQSMPWNFKPWGCASGWRGSCNGLKDGRFWIQFEICDDFYRDEDYFNKVYKEACELTAYLCKMYKINPKGSVSYNGANIPTILCHQDSYKLGMGSNHSDIYDWFNKFGKTMDDVRNDVAALLNGEEVEVEQPEKITGKFSEGDLVQISDDGKYFTGKIIPAWVKNKQWYIKEINGNRAIIDKDESGKLSINSPIDVKYLSKVVTKDEPADAIIVSKPATTKDYIEPTEECNVVLNVLKQNVYGNQVKRIQQLLTLDGYDCGGVDGMLGAKTINAIKKFQQDNGLTVDGVIGAETWRRILTGK